MYEISIDSDGAVIIPEKVLALLGLKKGDTLSLQVEDCKLIMERKKKITEDDYERLLDEAKKYASIMGLDENDCYQIIEEYLAENN